MIFFKNTKPNIPKLNGSAGFTVVELLVTLIIASLFITVFFQLFTLTDTLSSDSFQLAQADQITYRKVQQYENRNFSTIPVPGGTTPTQIEDFTSELPTTLPAPYKAIVLSAQVTPTLKALTIRTTYGLTGSTQRIIEFADYIQQSGLGR